MNKWDDRMLALAGLVATWSKDPSTGVGAVIAGIFSYIYASADNVRTDPFKPYDPSPVERREQLGVAEPHRPLHEPVDDELPGALVEARHRGVDRVDPPPPTRRRQRRAQTLGNHAGRRLRQPGQPVPCGAAPPQ